MIYVVDGIVKRIRPIKPDLDAWKLHCNKWEIPVGNPILDPAEVAEKFPTLGLSVGDALPAQRGKLREHRAL